MRKRSGKVWIVQYFDWTSTEDSYEEGELLGTEVTVFSERNVGIWPSFEKMKAGLEAQFGLPSDPDAWSIFSDPDDPGRIDVQFTVDENNLEADEKDIALWKKGRKKLWAAYVVINVLVGDVRAPSAGELIKMTKLQRGG
jgi:hypothetical protein